jgi:hypothetical protein
MRVNRPRTARSTDARLRPTLVAPPSAVRARHRAVEGLEAQGARAALGRPECVELQPGRRARPPRPGAGGRLSGPPRRAMGYRRDADLRPWRGRSRPAPAGVTTEWPAVRVYARGGGGGSQAGDPLRRLCLTQRRELRGRLNSLAHQLAERALLRAAGGRRGEHVFGRLRVVSDGTRTLRSSVRDPARIWLWTAQFARRNLQSILHRGLRQGPRARRERCGAGARLRGEAVGGATRPRAGRSGGRRDRERGGRGRERCGAGARPRGRGGDRG